jgi:hypothetical protein
VTFDGDTIGASLRMFFAFLEEFLATRGEQLEDFDDDGYSIGPRSFRSED